MKRVYYCAALAFAALTALCSCDPEKNSDIEEPKPAKSYTVKDFVAGYCIDTIYFWNEEVREKNKSVNPDQCNLEEYFDKLLYEEDRWSWMEDGKSFTESETGVISGTWGASFSQADDEIFENPEDYRRFQVRVSFIYPGSPLETFGVTRGAVMLGIGDKKDNLVQFTSEALEEYRNGISKSPQTFTFRLTNGTDTTFTASMAETLSTSPVHRVHVFDSSEFAGLTEPVGYFNYFNFKAGDFMDEMSDALKELLNRNIRKLILDFRYNTGGDLDACQLLMDLIAPASASGKVFLQYKHNKLLKSLNTSMSIAKSANSGLEDIYFITGRYTASASEIAINGLKPYMEGHIHLVGGQTYGKPNGMYVLIYPSEAEYYSDIDYVFYPISFFNYNSADELIPFDGFIPDNGRPDDLLHDWNAEEDLIKACLTHIASGEYPPFTPIPSSEPEVKSAGHKAGAILENDLQTMRPGLYIKLK